MEILKDGFLIHISGVFETLPAHYQPGYCVTSVRMFAEKVFATFFWFGSAFDHWFQTHALVTGWNWHVCPIQKGGR